MKSVLPVSRVIGNGLLVSLMLVSLACQSRRPVATRPVLDSGRPRVLFIGSSTIFFWKSLPQDFADVPVTVLRNGVGNRTLADIAAKAPIEIVAQHPDKVLIYAGSHDMHLHGRSPEQVFDDFTGLCDLVHESLPNTTVYFISCKPSIAKWREIELDRKLNTLVQQFADHERGVVYIDVYTPMLDEHGNPVESDFAPDKNHLSRQGYQLWTSVIWPYLLQPNE